MRAASIMFRNLRRSCQLGSRSRGTLACRKACARKVNLPQSQKDHAGTKLKRCGQYGTPCRSRKPGILLSGTGNYCFPRTGRNDFTRQSNSTRNRVREDCDGRSIAHGAIGLFPWFRRNLSLETEAIAREAGISAGGAICCPHSGRALTRHRTLRFVNKRKWPAPVRLQRHEMQPAS